MNKDEALKLALEAYIKAGVGNSTDFVLQGKAYDLAIGALAQPEQQKSGMLHIEKLDKWLDASLKKREVQPKQEPVASLWQHGETGRTRIITPDMVTDCDASWFKAADLYTAPPKRQPLTDEATDRCIEAADTRWADAFVPIQWARHFKNAIEAAHGIKEQP